eukprot:2019228-Pleurochrysis_carterae.AAC.1
MRPRCVHVRRSMPKYARRPRTALADLSIPTRRVCHHHHVDTLLTIAELPRAYFGPTVGVARGRRGPAPPLPPPLWRWGSSDGSGLNAMGSTP